jgi:hypothetical protein
MAVLAMIVHIRSMNMNQDLENVSTVVLLLMAVLVMIVHMGSMNIRIKILFYK